MKKDVFNKNGFVKTYQDGRSVVVIWEKLFDAQTIYDSCNAQLDLVKKDQADLIIIDVSNATGTPPMECQEWFGKTLFPGFASNPKFRGLINVLPKDALTKMGANRWKKTAENNFGFPVYEAESLEVAQKLAATI